MEREKAQGLTIIQADKSIKYYKKRPAPDEWQRSLLDRYGYDAKAIIGWSRDDATAKITELLASKVKPLYTDFFGRHD